MARTALQGGVSLIVPKERGTVPDRTTHGGTRARQQGSMGSFHGKEWDSPAGCCGHVSGLPLVGTWPWGNEARWTEA